LFLLLITWLVEAAVLVVARLAQAGQVVVVMLEHQLLESVLAVQQI
jgi:hypothetical protein